MLVTLPASSGSFAGLMPFSYVGCNGSTNVGTVSGTRSNTQLAGSWTGAVDGVGVGGSYVGSYDAATDRFTGTWANSGGKVEIGSVGNCHYYVASHGTWRLYGDTVNVPTDFILSPGTGLTPTWTWPTAGSYGQIAYLLRVFDTDCLARQVTNAACMWGEARTLNPRAAYPADFPSAKALVSGGHYLATLNAVDMTTGQNLGFSSVRYAP